MLRLLLRGICCALVVGIGLVLLACAAGTRTPRHIIAMIERAAPDQAGRLHLLDVRAGVIYGYPAQPSHDAFAWSPDGQWVALLSDDATLWLDDLWRPAASRVALNRKTIDFTPRWSPDGSRLLLGGVDQQDDTLQFWSIDASAGREVRLAMPPILDVPQGIDWFDNRRVLMRANYAESDSRFALVDLDQVTNTQYLPTSLNLYDRVLPFPDGDRWLLLGGWQLATVTQARPESPQPLHDFHVAYTHAAIAPDGERVAFISKPPPTYAGAWLVSTMPVTGGETDTLMRTTDILRGVSWSPDGAWVLVALTPQGSDRTLTELWLVRPDGSEQQMLRRAHLAALPVWSP